VEANQITNIGLLIAGNNWAFGTKGPLNPKSAYGRSFALVSIEERVPSTFITVLRDAVCERHAAKTC
jgi:hypothetical protein